MDHNFETDFFKHLSFNKQDISVTYIKAIRQVNHKPGLDKGCFAGIKGTLALSLPISLESVKFFAGKEVQEKQVAGIKMYLSSIEEADVIINTRAWVKTSSVFSALTRLVRNWNPCRVRYFPMMGRLIPRYSSSSRVSRQVLKYSSQLIFQRKATHLKLSPDTCYEV